MLALRAFFSSVILRFLPKIGGPPPPRSATVLYGNENVGTKGTDQMETSTSPEIALEKNYIFVPLELTCPTLFNCFTREKRSLEKESVPVYYI